MAQKVDADAAEKRAAPHPQFFADGLADGSFERWIETRPARHADGKAGCSAKPNTTRTIQKVEPRDAKPWDHRRWASPVALPQRQRPDAALPEVQVTVQHGQLFFGPQGRTQHRSGLGKAFPSLPAGNRCLEFTSGRQGKVTPNSLRFNRGIALQKRFFKL